MEDNLDVTAYHCQRCNQPDHADAGMVQCDACNKWEHFTCAGVDASVKKLLEYICKSCTAKSTAAGAQLQAGTSQQTLLTVGGKKQPKSTASKTGSRRGKKDTALDTATTSKASATSSVRAARLLAQLKIWEEQEKLQEQQAKQAEEIQRKELEEEQRQFEEKKKLVEQERKMREKKLAAEKALKEKNLLLRKQSMDKKHEIQRQLAECSSRGGSVPDSREKVEQWLDDQRSKEETVSSDVPLDPSGTNNDRASDPFDIHPYASGNDIHPHASGNDLNPVLPVTANAVYSSGPGTTGAPSNQQIAARQVMGRDLPSFNGDPEDWPMFISSFEQTTAACGYSEVENLNRLQRCLKGRALDAVRSRLYLPSGIPLVIKTLRTLYGRPEALIQSLSEKIRRAPPPRHDRLETIIDYGLNVQNLVDHLKAAKQEAHLNNPTLLRELIEKLPTQIKLDWATFKRKYSNVALEIFSEFMTLLVDAASEVSYEFVGATKSSRKEKGFVQSHSSEQSPTTTEQQTPTSSLEKYRKRRQACVACDHEGHRVVDCVAFKAMDTDARWRFVQQKGLCRTCLNNHGRWPCQSWKGCGIDGCRNRHHTLLHSDYSSPHQCNVSSSLIQPADHHSFFRILPVVVFNKHCSQIIFAFIDEGSSLTLIDESVAKKLSAEGPTEPLTLQWTGSVTRREDTSIRIQLEIAGKGKSQRFNLHDTHTVRSLKLPSQSLNYKELSDRLPHLRGLPIEDHDHVQPQLLIGLDNLRLAVPLRVREGRARDPIAAKCRLGWAIYGSQVSPLVPRVNVNFHVGAAIDSDRELNDQLRDYFALESIGVAAPLSKIESDNDKRAKRLLEETTRRVESGFETGLLWKSDYIEFPDSYPMALRRLCSLEKKLENDHSLKLLVQKQIDDYIKKGYAHKAIASELQSTDPRRVWYLPLGVVLNPKKPGKIRLIWDAAAKVHGISLNTQLLKGPDLLTPLPGVLSRFRQFRYAVCGDIREMFHQIKIIPVDRQSQRFLWREKSKLEPQVYVMDVATFGSTCSPCSSQYVKNLNAREFADQYPRATAAIEKSHYVDDYLDSFESTEEAIATVNAVKFVHSEGGFEIRNFLSNSQEILQRTHSVPKEDMKELSLVKGEEPASVLGIQWMPQSDVFTYAFSLREDLKSILDENHVPSKREILRVVMSLFDPLGFVSFFLVHGKILLQDIWASGTNWDEPIRCDLNRKWRQWTNYFPQLDTLRIPRCYFRSPFPKGYESLQLHIFVDASEAACAAVAYFRIETEEGAQIAFICGKTKVAPLKTLSIPRLELLAAVMGARLLEYVRSVHSIPIQHCFIWTDSSTVLAWIHSEHRRYHKFVAVRIGEILTIAEGAVWRWVPTRHNVADEATKWGSGPNMDSNGRWFKGPEFLHEPENVWPIQKQVLVTEEEIRIVHTHWTPPVSVVDASRFSKWERMHRAVAYVHRFVENLRRKRSGRNLLSGILEQEELKVAEECLWKQAQKEDYSDEITILQRSKGSPISRHYTVPKTSSIYNRWPFMDEKGIVRMRGRIGAAPYTPTNAKYPVILPNRSRISFLIVDWYHRRYRHANREIIKNEMRQCFEISKLLALIGKVDRVCMHCRMLKALPHPPPMADLPEMRLTPFVRPFTFVGLDYFGPVMVKVGRNVAKRWIALFTCLSVRAIHLEVVYGLSTESCIMAVRRFINRRGTPSQFYTDNGTCFQGAKRILYEQIKERNEALAAEFSSVNTKWSFIPPGAPHMGGVWERLVRSVKTAVESIMDAPRKLDDETLETVMIEAEGMINARPLTHIPLESADQEALTPNHFLLGSSSGIKRPFETTNHGCVLRNSWRLAQHVMNEFWRRWLKEYLPVITRCCKLFEEVRDLAVGDLVFVVGGSTRSQWLRGRVEVVFPGRDGRVRSALVRTGSGALLRRPVVKLAVLDVIDIGNPDCGLAEQHQDLRVGECDDEKKPLVAERQAGHNRCNVGTNK